MQRSDGHGRRGVTSLHDQLPPTCTQRAELGMPPAFCTQSMYQPGGAILLFEVSDTENAPLPVFVSGKLIKRWFGSDECVTAAGLMSSADAMLLLPVMRCALP